MSLRKVFLSFITIFIIFLLFPNPAMADVDCGTHLTITSEDIIGGEISSGTLSQISFTVEGSSGLADGTYYLRVVKPLSHGLTFCEEKEFSLKVGEEVTFSKNCAVNRVTTLLDQRRWVKLFDSSHNYICNALVYNIKPPGTAPDKCHLVYSSDEPEHPDCVDVNSSPVISGTITVDGDDQFTGHVRISVGQGIGKAEKKVEVSEGVLKKTTFSPPFPIGSYRVKINKIGIAGISGQLICEPNEEIPVIPDCEPGEVTLPVGGTSGGDDFYPVGPEECPGSTPDDPVLRTSLGCIHTNPEGLVKWLFGFAGSLAGGIAFLLMAWGAFLFITSQGNPDQLQRAKETIISAIGGLLFIIFAVFLLRLIGFDILKIPGFE